MDYKRVLDHVRAKSLYQDEPALDGKSLLAATEQLLATDEYSCLSNEFKQELK